MISLNSSTLSILSFCLAVGSILGTVNPLQAQNQKTEETIRSPIILDSNPEILFEKGVTEGEAGHYQSAVAIFSEVITTSPLSAEAYYNRGLSLDRLGELDRAIADYSQALRLDSEYVPAYINRGNLYSQQGDHEQAVTDFSRAIAVDPNRYKAYYNRGNSYFQLSKYYHVIADYETVLILKPDYIDAIYNRGLTYYRLGNLDKSRQDLFQAAQSYLNRGDRASYLEALDRITELNL
jgi:tetratricopeptide (TPR) repeat protein